MRGEGRGLRVAADAHTGEPSSGKADFTPPLAKLRGTVCTPHIGASTAQAQEAVAEEAVRIVGAFAAEGSVPNCVNLTVRSPARWQIVVRHHDRVGVLASVLNLLKENEINVQEVDTASSTEPRPRSAGFCWTTALPRSCWSGCRAKTTCSTLS